MERARCPWLGHVRLNQNNIKIFSVSTNEITNYLFLTLIIIFIYLPTTLLFIKLFFMVSFNKIEVRNLFFCVLSVILTIGFILPFSIAEASTNLFELNEKRVQQDKPFISAVVDTSLHENLTFSFSYDATTLDGFASSSGQDQFSYGWQTGSEKHILGTVLGLTGSTTEEYGAVNMVLPESASVVDLVLFIEVVANTTSTSDKVEVKNILLTGTEKLVEPEPVDVCPNLDGIQAGIPAGYEKDDSGACVIIEVEEPIVDVCLNLDGIQTVIPEGYVKNEQNECVLPPPPTVVDVCPNLDGIQSELPANYQYKDGDCVPVLVDPTPEPKPVPKFCPKGYAKWIDRFLGGNVWSADDVYESVILVAEETGWKRGYLLNKNIHISGPTEIGDKYYHRFHRISHICVR